MVFKKPLEDKNTENGGVDMVKAVWNDTVLAESDTFEMVEGNVYFPPAALRREYFTESSHQSVCPWKGTARYYSITVEGARNPDAAWYYPDPKPAAENIRDYVAFWRGVEVTQ